MTLDPDLYRDLWCEIDAARPRYSRAIHIWDAWLEVHGIEPTTVLISTNGVRGVHGFIRRDLEARRVYYRAVVLDEVACTEVRCVQLESPPLPFPTTGAVWGVDDE